MSLKGSGKGVDFSALRHPVFLTGNRTQVSVSDLYHNQVLCCGAMENMLFSQDFFKYIFSDISLHTVQMH